MCFGLRYGIIALFLFLSNAVSAQQDYEMIPFGDMDSWVVRRITESAVIGKQTKLIYAIDPVDTIVGNSVYRAKSSPWGCSNVMAKVSGITKASSSVYPERRGDGYAARLESCVESISAFGIMNIKVLVGGSIFLGYFLEPAKNSSETWGQIVCGIPFNRRPKSLMFDYRVKLSGDSDRVRMSGMSKRSVVKGKDMAAVNLFLQRRWEDKDGNIYAKRIATLVLRMDRDCDWVDDASFDILYGDISGRDDFDPSSMGLLKGEDRRYGLYSRGENVPIQEVGWGTGDEKATHIILEFCSSHGGSYVGSPGNTFWIDNVRLGYSK